MSDGYRAGSLTLSSTVAMGTGVMIGAGIFALTGQVAEYAGALFPLAFLLAAVVSAFSAYSYVKVTRKYPSAGGIAMILEKAWGQGVVTGGCSLLMALSMVINESLVARTFGTYTMQLLPIESAAWHVPALAVGLIAAAWVVNVAGNEIVGAISRITAALKIGGILLFAGVALYAAGFDFAAARGGLTTDTSGTGFLASIALAILAYKGFTTITNSGDEVEYPERNVGRAIMTSLAICTAVYMLVAYAVGAGLTIDEIIAARDYSLAEAARPALGEWGVRFTVAIAIIATASGLLASIFAVSRMLAMLTRMQIIPHRHFGMRGDIQDHTLVFTVVLAALLAVFFDLGRIASLGAIFYLVMDSMVHIGVLRTLREELDARPWILVTAIGLDLGALVCFLAIKGGDDPAIVVGGALAVTVLFAFERFYLSRRRDAWTTEDIRAGDGD